MPVSLNLAIKSPTWQYWSAEPLGFSTPFPLVNVTLTQPVGPIICFWPNHFPSPPSHLVALSPDVDVDPLVHESALPDGPRVRWGVHELAALVGPAVLAVILDASHLYDPRVAVNAMLLQHSGWHSHSTLISCFLSLVVNKLGLPSFGTIHKGRW